MAKEKKEKDSQTGKILETTKNQFTKGGRSNELKPNLKKSHMQLNSCRKKEVASIIKNEHQFILNLFDILDLAKLNQGRRNESDEDENSDTAQLADLPEQKVFKKHTEKKGASQVSLKNKSFPQTIEGLEKELAELKGTPLTYQNKLRKKGLHSRLIKKKRKEQIKLKKAARKSAKKHNATTNGVLKTKLVLNSDGNVVSNKFDFADMDIKKDIKKKQGTANKEISSSHSGNLSNGPFNQSGLSQENFLSNLKTESNKNNRVKNSTLKKENIILGSNKEVSNHDVKSTSKQGPLFNKDNKMVFSKVYIPENHKMFSKKESKKSNPKKVLQKLKEENKKISELEKEDQEKAISLKEKQKWTAALKRASGEKVKDDPELLRKSIAREKNKKMRSQKKWKARVDHVEKEKEAKQKKRKDNILARKNEKKKKKMKKAIKKGSYVPV